MTNPNYDIAVVYRIYPKVSKKPPVFSDDKYKLSELCLKSFKDSLGAIKIKMWVLLDNCPQEYEILFKKYFNSEDLELVKLNGIGNQATFNMQIQILLEQNVSQAVYFAEDDYFYLPKQFANMIEFLKNNEDVHFVSPYDHLDCYTLDLHKHNNYIKICGDKHWRTANSTCLTFLTTKATLQETQGIFKSYAKGNYDASLWISLTKYKVFNLLTIFRYFRKDKFLYEVIKAAWFHCWQQILFGKRWNLWIPIPSIATHMESSYLAPTIDWANLMNQEVKA